MIMEVLRNTICLRSHHQPQSCQSSQIIQTIQNKRGTGASTEKPDFNVRFAKNDIEISAFDVNRLIELQFIFQEIIFNVLVCRKRYHHHLPSICAHFPHHPSPFFD